jgi:chemotaxis protein CheZ
LTVLIYTACGFQDITGQRITKVVSALKNIEMRVDELISALDTGSNKGRKAKAPKKKPKKISKKRATTGVGHNDDELLQGPQHKDQAIKQEDIEALLADVA